MSIERFTDLEQPTQHIHLDEESPFLSNVHLGAVKALSAFMASSDNFNLHGIEVECHEEGIFATATNGHVLITLELDPEPVCGGRSTGRTFYSGESVKRFVESKGYTPMDREDSNFPDVRQAIPASFDEPGPAIGIDAKYMDSMLKALKALKLVGGKKSQPVKMQHNGAFSPMLFTVEHPKSDVVTAIWMVVMPMRLD